MKTDFRIALLPGDGIGPDVIAEAVRVLRAIEERTDDFALDMSEFSIGAGEYLAGGDPLPEHVFEQMAEFDAILLGAMGLPGVRWPDGTEMAPQLDLRERLDLYSGVRPFTSFIRTTLLCAAGRRAISTSCCCGRAPKGSSPPARRAAIPQADRATDTMLVTRAGAERVIRAAFRIAAGRKHRVTLVDKANVLPSMAFFRQVFDEIAGDFPEVQTDRVYVDAAALYLVQRPEMFDVMVTENMFGDILSDLGAALVGGMGMAPSADIGEKYAVFQPSHGSAPDIAGKGIANPAATILSAAMMLEWLDTALRGAARL